MQNREQLLELATAVARNTISVLDVGMQRGAFTGEEALAIGQLRMNCVQLQSTVEAMQSENEETDE